MPDAQSLTVLDGSQGIVSIDLAGSSASAKLSLELGWSLTPIQPSDAGRPLVFEYESMAVFSLARSALRWVSRFWASVWVGVVGGVAVTVPAVIFPSGASSRIFLLSPIKETVDAVVFFSPIWRVESG